jgi:hypothetical protein
MDRVTGLSFKRFDYTANFFQINFAEIKKVITFASASAREAKD